MNADNELNNTETKSLSTVLDELISQNLITPDERKEIEETGQVTIGSRTIIFDTITMNPQNVGRFYGKTVKNYTDKQGNSDYQLFYIDYDNKYGDGAGTIYLKKKESVTSWNLSDYNKVQSYQDTTGLNLYSISNLENMPIVYRMNQKWRENLTSTPENKSAKFTAFLCNSNNWKDYDEKGRTVGEGTVNYAIGGPSLELFVDSINQAIDSQNPELKKFDCKVDDRYGYEVATLTSGEGPNYSTSTGKDTVPASLAEEMYAHADDVDYQIITSPIDGRDDGIFYMDDYWHCISNQTTFGNGSRGVTVLVSLSADFNLEFVD